MKIKVYLSVGYGVEHEEVIDLEDNFDNLAPDIQESQLIEVAREWADYFIDVSYRVIEEED